MKKIFIRVFSLFFMGILVSCASCDLFNEKTSGTVIKSISAPFTINDDIIFVNTTNDGLEPAVPNYTYVVNMQTRTIISVITYKYGRTSNGNFWGPAQVVPVHGKLWVLGANSMDMRNEVFIVNPGNASLEKTLTYEITNSYRMYYLASIDKVVLTHGRTYGNYHGNSGSPVTVFDPVQERYEKMYWLPEAVNQFREDNEGNVWGFKNHLINAIDELGIYTFGATAMTYETKYVLIDGTCAATWNSIRGWPYVILPDGTAICSTGRGIMCKYADGTTSVVPAGYAISDYNPLPREIEYCPLADRVFVNAVLTGTKIGIAVLEKDVNGKWVKTNTIIEDPNQGFLVRNGILVTACRDKTNRARYYLNFYSTTSLAAGSLEKLGTLKLVP